MAEPLMAEESSQHDLVTCRWMDAALQLPLAAERMLSACLAS